EARHDGDSMHHPRPGALAACAGAAGAAPLGQITEFNSGFNPGATVGSLTPGPDGNLWFADRGTTAIAQVTRRAWSRSTRADSRRAAFRALAAEAGVTTAPAGRSASPTPAQRQP